MCSEGDLLLNWLDLATCLVVSFRTSMTIFGHDVFSVWLDELCSGSPWHLIGPIEWVANSDGVAL